MTIPQATLDTITSALKASRVTVELTCYEPGAEEAPQIHRADHHWIKFSSKLDHQERARVAILLQGMSVRQDGIFWKAPTDAAAETPPNEAVTIQPPDAPEPKEAEGTVEAVPDAAPIDHSPLTDEQTIQAQKMVIEALSEDLAEIKERTAAVADAQPAKPRIEIKTVIQTFRVNQPEIAQMVNEQYARYLNEGWIPDDSASVLNPVGDTYEFVRVVTFKRAA